MRHISLRKTEEPPQDVNWSESGLEITLYTGLNDSLKHFVDLALKNNVVIHHGSIEAALALDNYITGANA